MKLLRYLSAGLLGSLVLGIAGCGGDDSTGPGDQLEPPPPFLLEWGKRLTDPGRLQAPTGIAVGPAGKVYVADSGHDIIQVYSPSGTPLDTLMVATDFASLYVDGSGILHVFGQSDYRRYDAAGQLLDAGGFSEVQSVVEDSQGRLLLSGTWTPSAGPPETPGVWMVVDPSAPARLDGLAPELLGVAPGGDLLVGSFYLIETDIYSQIERYTENGAYLDKFAIGEVGFRILEFQVDASGDLIVIDFGDNALSRFSPQGKLLARWDETDANHEPLDRPLGIALDGDGNLYVTDWTQNRVVKYGPN